MLLFVVFGIDAYKGRFDAGVAHTVFVNVDKRNIDIYFAIGVVDMYTGHVDVDVIIVTGIGIVRIAGFVRTDISAPVPVPIKTV